MTIEQTHFEKKVVPLRNEIIKIAEGLTIKDSNDIILKLYSIYEDVETRTLIESLILCDIDLQFIIKDPLVIFSREMILEAKHSSRLIDTYSTYIENINSIGIETNNLRKYFYENQDIFKSIFYTNKFLPTVIHDYELLIDLICEE